MKRNLFLSLFLAFGLVGMSHAQSGPNIDVTAVSRQGGTIVDFLNQHSTPGDANAACFQWDASGAAFNCLMLALQHTGLSNELSLVDELGVTLFAPTDAAFELLSHTMSPAEWSALFTDANALRPLLSNHLLPVKMTLSDLFDKTSDNFREVMVITQNGMQVPVIFGAGGGVTDVTLGVESSVGTPHVIAETIELDNGVIIAINNVLTGN